MEVNKPEPAAVLKRDGRKSAGYKSPHDGDESDQDQQGEQGEGRPEEDAFRVDSGLTGPISPEVQNILNGLAAQIEPLRQELERTRARESMLHEQAQQHPYLPVLNRFGLENEFTKILGHLESLGSATFVCVSVLDAEHFRRYFGRHVYEQAMTHVCNMLQQVTRDDDRVGCLGGHDLGVLLLASSENFVEELARKLRQALSDQPFNCNGTAVALDVMVGGKAINAGSTLTQTLGAVDMEFLIKR